MGYMETKFQQAVAECLPALTEVYLLRTRIECAAHLYECGGLPKPLFAEELKSIRTQLDEMKRG